MHLAVSVVGEVELNLGDSDGSGEISHLEVPSLLESKIERSNLALFGLTLEPGEDFDVLGVSLGDIVGGLESERSEFANLAVEVSSDPGGLALVLVPLVPSLLSVSQDVLDELLSGATSTDVVLGSHSSVFLGQGELDDFSVSGNGGRGSGGAGLFPSPDLDLTELNLAEAGVLEDETEQNGSHGAGEIFHLEVPSALESKLEVTKTGPIPRTLFPGEDSDQGGVSLGDVVGGLESERTDLTNFTIEVKVDVGLLALVLVPLVPILLSVVQEVLDKLLFGTTSTDVVLGGDLGVLLGQGEFDHVSFLLDGDGVGVKLSHDGFLHNSGDRVNGGGGGSGGVGLFPSPELDLAELHLAVSLVGEVELNLGDSDGAGEVSHLEVPSSLESKIEVSDFALFGLTLEPGEDLDNLGVSLGDIVGGLEAECSEFTNLAEVSGDPGGLAAVLVPLVPGLLSVVDDVLDELLPGATSADVKLGGDLGVGLGDGVLDQLSGGLALLPTGEKVVHQAVQVFVYRGISGNLNAIALVVVVEATSAGLGVGAESFRAGLARALGAR